MGVYSEHERAVKVWSGLSLRPSTKPGGSCTLLNADARSDKAAQDIDDSLIGVKDGWGSHVYWISLLGCRPP